MSDRTALKVEKVSKTFKLPHEKQNSLKGLFLSLVKSRTTYEQQAALKNINFEVKKGEFFGIVGRNGSGKSTLLKLLAGIYSADKGRVEINGKLTPFIELGVGFNQELTGRENVYLNGALLGFSRKEMTALYDEIVEFAELERFMDQKLKNYSSGMQVRLAFSIAIRAESDILLIDEVLAVGDVAFQKKCLQYFETLKRNKKTVVFVTHDMASVERYCTKVLVIDKSKQIGIFTPLEAKNVYDEINASGSSGTKTTENKTPQRWGNKNIEISKIELVSNGKLLSDTDTPVVHGKELQIKLGLSHNKSIDSVVGIAIYDDQGLNVSGPNSAELKIGKATEVIYTISQLNLNAGDYHLAVGVFDKATLEELDYMPQAVEFRVSDPGIQKYGKVDLFGLWQAK